MNVTSFKNSWSAIKSIHKVLYTSNIKYSDRPRNRFEPANSMWWLVPSSEWPCYRFGKYVVNEDYGTMNFGIHVEKGFGKPVAAFDSNVQKHGQIIDESWIWQKFMIGLQSGEVTEAMEIIEKNVNQPVSISVYASPISDSPKFDPYEADRGYYSIRFDLQNGNLIIVDQTEVGALASLKKIKEISEIPDILSNLNSNGLNLDWFWIDMYVYVGLHKVNNDDNVSPDINYDESLIYSRILKPLEKWCDSGN